MKLIDCLLAGLPLLVLVSQGCRTPCTGVDPLTAGYVPPVTRQAYVRGQNPSGGMTTPFPTFAGLPAVSSGENTTSSPAITVPAPRVEQVALVDSEGFATSSSASFADNQASGATPSAVVTRPPDASEVPAVAKNTYGNSLEQLPQESQQNTSTQQRNGQNITVPKRSRESLVDKESTEKEQKDLYKKWVEEQKQAKKGSAAVPQYLRPLTDDRKVFDDPNSPFARKQRAENDHRFVRQITAADLTMMQDVGARELLDWEKDQDMPVDWSKYSAKSVWNKWRDWLGMGPDEKEAIALMIQAAEKHMEYEETKNVKALKSAAELYEKAGKKWPDSVLNEDALFYAGECRFFAGEYTKALYLYSELVSKYTNSILKRDATHRLYMIGCYWVDCYEAEGVGINVTDSGKPRFSSFAGAKKAFEAIFMNDASEHGLAPDALFALANAYMRRGQEQGDASFDSAAKYYRQLYEFYPGCKHTDKSYQLAMLALHRSYRGPLYDDRPLKQAQDIALAAQRSGRGDKQLIAEELQAVKEEQAKHLWVRGEYYEKQGRFGSSRNYYNRLAKEFPDSEYARKAAVRYNEIKDKPAEVDQFAWIRPVAPFMPKPNTDYFEDQPVSMVRMAAAGELNSGDKTKVDDFTGLGDDKAKNKNASSSKTSPQTEKGTGM